MPLLEELDYIPKRRYAPASEIFEHCQAIARRYGLYDESLLQTTVIETSWQESSRRWLVRTDKGDELTALHVVMANGPLSAPKLAKIDGMETFDGQAFHTSRWDYERTGKNLEHLRGKRVGVVGTGASAVQAIPLLAEACEHLYVFQRTPATVLPRGDKATKPEWAAARQGG
jgi:cyclohexanone monooxygenase/pentalenolactone D synthase